MEYKNLHELINFSHSSREFFLSLPVNIQCRLHERKDSIRNAYQLHKAAYAEYDFFKLLRLSNPDSTKK